MKKLQLEGCGTALVTPFKDGAVDYEAYATLIDRQVEAGIDFLVPLATTAETPTLSVEEKIELMKLTRSHAPQTPLLVGCGSNSIPGTLANMKLVDDLGVDAWLVVVPFYNKPTQEGMFQYFKAIAESTDKPVVIYNVPGRTGSNMTAKTCIRLANEVPNIIGIKEASGNMEQVRKIIEGVPAGFSVLSGDDWLTLELIRSGGQGVISVASNIAPAEMVGMTRSALEGTDMKEAARIDELLKPLFNACFVESNPVPVKAGLEMLGLCSAEVRLPLTKAQESTYETMKEAMIWK